MLRIIERQQKSSDLIESMLINRGVNDINLFMNPTNESDTDLHSLPHIYEAVEMIKKNITKTIMILVDSDADGNSSAALMYKYLKMVNPNAKLLYYIHPCKTHGLVPDVMKYVLEKRPDMLIVPDAGTNDIEERELLQSEGIDLLIIDHHNEDRYTDKGGILINNHANFPKNNINKNLTGSGMTFTVCKAFDKFAFHTNRVEELKDLAMIGAIGDGAGLIENETRNFCLSAINNIKSKLIQAVMKFNNQTQEEMTFTDMQFGGVVPLINAVVRVGTFEERELMFKALADIEPDYFEIVTKRKLNKEIRKYEQVEFKYDIYQLAVEAAKKCKDRQAKLIDIEMKVADKQFNPETGIQIYILQSEECRGLTGLLANKLASHWQQPTIVVWEVNGDYSGSLRGREKVISNFKEWCTNTKLFKLVQGHDNAAGVIFDKNNLDKIVEAAKNIESEEYKIEVDKIYNRAALVQDVYYVSSKLKMFNGVQPPIFAVTNFEVNEMNAKWSKNTLRVNVGGVTYIKFKTLEQEYQDLLGQTIDIVGEFSLNKWNGRTFPQFVIKEYDVSNTQKESIDFGIFA